MVIKILSNLLTTPILQSVKIGQNPSFGSRGRLKTSCFWSKYDIQIAGVTLKVRSLLPPPPIMFLCQFGQNPLIGSEERVQTRSYADADWIRIKSKMFHALPFGCGRGGHNLALTDSVISEKMFEECGRRQRQACLYLKLTNQYIKLSARLIRSKIRRIKMTYTFKDDVPTEDNHQLHSLFRCSIPVTQTGF